MATTGHWAMVPMSALMRLHGKAREVYEWHCLVAWRDTGISDWSQKRIAVRLGINIRSVQRAESDLLSDGWLLYTAVDDKGAGVRQAGLKVNDPFPETLKTPEGTGRRTRRTYDMGTDGVPVGYTAHVDRKDGACAGSHTAQGPTLPEPEPKPINHTKTESAREVERPPAFESAGGLNGSKPRSAETCPYCLAETARLNSLPFGYRGPNACDRCFTAAQNGARLELARTPQREPAALVGDGFGNSDIPF